MTILVSCYKGYIVDSLPFRLIFAQHYKELVHDSEIAFINRKLLPTLWELPQKRGSAIWTVS